MKWEVVVFFSFLEKKWVFLLNTDLLLFLLFLLHQEGRKEGRKEERWKETLCAPPPRPRCTCSVAFDSAACSSSCS